MGCSFRSMLITGESFDFDLFSWENEQNPESPWSILVLEYWAPPLPQTALRGEIASMSVYRRKTQKIAERWSDYWDEEEEERKCRGFLIEWEKKQQKLVTLLTSRKRRRRPMSTVYAETCCSYVGWGPSISNWIHYYYWLYPYLFYLLRSWFVPIFNAYLTGFLT